jgi:L-ascorbate metabolism protein UlaG (beta-lactamase superfamily)
MSNNQIKITYIGGPTAMIEMGGLKLLTDPTFDPAETFYPSGPVTLHKTVGPALTAKSLGQIDWVLLSHDHHADNLDNAGRAMLKDATRVLTTAEGAERLGGNATGLLPWQSVDVPAKNGRTLKITATPARHGPDGGDRGPCIGFVLAFPDAPSSAVYVSGDTVWYDGTAEIANRFNIATAVLFLGAARVPEVAGNDHLTMNGPDGVSAAQAFPKATIVPVHYEGWTHFSEPRAILEPAFRNAGVASRVRWMDLGKTIELPNTN